MALEHVYMWNNTSLIHDEVLCHRLGLVPLNVDPRLFDEFGLEVEEESGEFASTDRNTIVFRLHVVCGRDEKEDDKLRKKMEKKWKVEGLVSGYDVEVEQAKKKKSDKKDDSDDDDDDMAEEGDDQDPSVMGVSVVDEAAKAALNLKHADIKKTPIDSASRPFTRHVYTRDLLWAPQGDQLSNFPLQSAGVGSGVGGGIRPITEDILLAKLRPGQVIELEAHARKGVGKDHAKFSPVATASYRLMPQIEIIKPIYDELAEELVNWFEPGVFTLVPVDKAEKKQGYKQKAQVSNPYACTMSRNFMRNPVLKESIKMTRIPNHFIFNVESVGMMEPAVIVAEALKILKDKCERVVELADGALASMEG